MPEAKPEEVMHWRGKRIESYSKEELIDIIKKLYNELQEKREALIARSRLSRRL